MGTITIVGLGPGPADLLTARARAALDGEIVYVRTRSHPALIGIPGALDPPSLEERLDGATEVLATLVAFLDDVLVDAASADVVYAVPGHPLVTDASVRILRERAASRMVSVQVVPGLSVVDSVAEAAGPQGLGDGAQLVDLLDLAGVAERAPFAGGRSVVSPLRPAVILNPRPASLLRICAAALERLYPSDALVTVIPAPSAAGEPLRLTVGELGARGESAWTAALYLPPVSYEASGRTADALQQIVARLRAPGGCPWDREQTHESLLQSGLEEAYEVLDAIQRGDAADMAEELGDLLLQVFLHAQIAEESGEFALEDVYGAVTAKLVRRHPHVFGDVVAATAGEVLENWDQIKRGERRDRGEGAHENPLGKIPSALPALMRAQTVLRRAQRAGLLRIDEARLRDAVLNALDPAEPVDRAVLVDALLAISLAATGAGIDLEEELRDRSHRIEASARRIAATGPPHDDSSADHQDGRSSSTEGDRPA